MKEEIRARYAELALKDMRVSCGSTAYTPTDLVGLPPEAANLSLGCGNPVALASLRPGEVVLDIGSGAGIDVFLAAQRVGSTGRAIGLDMTGAMIQRARHAAEQAGFSNVEFRLGDAEDMPLPDASVDVIISNCVINLSLDKGRVFREAYRVLRPGGRLMISDIVTDKPLPESVRSDADEWSSCVGGAIPDEDYSRLIGEAGFERVICLHGLDFRRVGDVRVYSANISAKKQETNKEVVWIMTANGHRVEIFDPPMCCPTGLCGPTTDPVLLDLYEMVLKLKDQGIAVERYQMSAQPQAFMSNAEVYRLLRERQLAALPITVVDGQLVKVGAYPTLAEVQAALGGGN